MQIRPYKERDLEAVVRLSLRAWAPVFESLAQVLDPAVYDHFYPDWRADQQKAVEDVCTTGAMAVWVADVDERAVAFVAIKLDRDSRMGEIYMIAVDPDQQQRGIASALTEFALAEMRKAGMGVAMVETGGDPGHAPARRTYEKAGFGLFTAARYFKKL